MTDWYVTTPRATGLVTTEEGRVTRTPPIWRWMIGKSWHACRTWLIAQGGNGEPLP